MDLDFLGLKIGPSKPDHISICIDPFLTILYSFDNPHSRLSNESKNVKNGCVVVENGPSECCLLSWPGDDFQGTAPH